MKKNSTMVIGIIIILAVLGGAFAIFHKSYKTPASTTASATNSSASAVNNSVLVTKSSASLGSYLAEPNGDALYTYNGDSSGTSTVTGSLLASWPAYQDTGSTTGLPTGVGTIKRTDNGQTQFTYNGMPLYTFVADSSGQVTGNGVSNFSVAKPAATSSSQATTTTPSSTPPQSPNNSPSY